MLVFTIIAQTQHSGVMHRSTHDKSMAKISNMVATCKATLADQRLLIITTMWRSSEVQGEDIRLCRIKPDTI